MQPIRVDFYLMTSDNAKARWLLACRLLEKAYARQHNVFVYCNNKQDAELIDELLWTFKDDSFIPHHLQGEGLKPPPPIQIGYGDEPKGYHDILLNLADEIPAFYLRFSRIMEVVLNNEQAKELSRVHYRLYRSKQYDLHTHTIA
ncbi:DNA polymerase III subunit chi [Legionella beliardensis]|uniref:DNA polymerase III subunit chi n=1 Tax=Legionella beliardensis TaxID=91822 RepID=A0A378I2Q8_9GAMM|nr:DNA polymerase III subunit chi [Legionella beliardensis]STX29448.1 DNA polymerase III subunit chi [Legionella beliardensis]